MTVGFELQYNHNGGYDIWLPTIFAPHSISNFYITSYFVLEITASL